MGTHLHVPVVDTFLQDVLSGALGPLLGVVFGLGIDSAAFGIVAYWFYLKHFSCCRTWDPHLLRLWLADAMAERELFSL